MLSIQGQNSELTVNLSSISDNNLENIVFRIKIKADEEVTEH